jgi:hypothetical protein
MRSERRLKDFAACKEGQQVQFNVLGAGTRPPEGAGSFRRSKLGGLELLVASRFTSCPVFSVYHDDQITDIELSKYSSFTMAILFRIAHPAPRGAG